MLELSLKLKEVFLVVAWRHTNNPIPTNVKEHNDYVLVYRVGNGLLPQHRRWANINPLTITKINGVEV